MKYVLPTVLRRIAAIAVFAVLILAGCNPDTDGHTSDTPDTPVTFISLTADGSITGGSVVNTTKLTLVFDKDINGLREEDISLNKKIKGSLTRTATGTYELGLTDIISGGSVTVSVSKPGYIITGGPKTVPIYRDVIAIKTQPASRQMTLAGWTALTDEQKALKVVMEDDTQAYQYQWYSNNSFSSTGGNAISGAVNSSYKPNITQNGTYYYYVTVARGGTVPGVTSNPAMIMIADAVSNPADRTVFTIRSERLNYVRGVGGTGAFMFRTGGNADASPDADVRYIDLLFGELGCNILRIMVQDDYLNYIQNKVQSRNQNVFFHNARDNFFAVIRRANEYGGYVFANPWTAPGSMKTDGKDEGGLAGGTLTEKGPNYVDYAEHLRSFLKWLNANNAPIFALGILNEPDIGHKVLYEGMGMSPQVSRDWFKTVGHFTTEKVTNRDSAGPKSSDWVDDIIPGWGGGGPTHHVLAMSGDPMGDLKGYMDPQLSDTDANRNIELIGRHYYTDTDRYTRVAGDPPHNDNPTAWFDRPQLNYTGLFELESLAMSRQMYAPGSKAGSIKREIWQTEHDFNFGKDSINLPAGNPQRYWNSAFAALNDVDWCLRVAGESVFDWWYSSSFSGLVTSYQSSDETTGFPPYTITPRGRAFAHYARYVNETWLLPIECTQQNDADPSIVFNKTGTSASPKFNAGATDPKISAFEDVNGKFISVVMYTPTTSTSNAADGTINPGFGNGGTQGNNSPISGSANVGRIAVVLPDGFVASSASALRSYGNAIATADDASWGGANPVQQGSPRYWIDEPVFVSADGKSVELTLPAGNVISVMIRGQWTGPQASARHFEERARPFTVQ